MVLDIAALYSVLFPMLLDLALDSGGLDVDDTMAGSTIGLALLIFNSTISEARNTIIS